MADGDCEGGESVLRTMPVVAVYGEAISGFICLTTESGKSCKSQCAPGGKKRLLSLCSLSCPDRGCPRVIGKSGGNIMPVVIIGAGQPGRQARFGLVTDSALFRHGTLRLDKLTFIGCAGRGI
ncbi:MAG: hypothetical protein DU429_07945 [Candidatus Tokpelaia sp.]|nr:MAG: hypothetical protein DU429_07945 [Candidatus Tokpelaia sp.]KAA6206088.1 MAG: hypothetical protein DU430_02320 [Candidatus Tokpelaia sp.]